MKDKKVFVTGFFDLLNSGQVSFLKEAAQLGDLYVGIGSDQTFEDLKGRKPVCSEQERLYMVKALRHVKDAFLMEGGHCLRPCLSKSDRHADTDQAYFEQTLDRIHPDIFVVNFDGDNDQKKKACKDRGIEYVISGQNQPQRPHHPSAPSVRLPYRIDIAGTWIDQPYVSKHSSGWAITASIEPTYEFMERGGMSTSTRNAAKKIWPVELPAYNEEMLARLLFCFENDPENEGHVSGAQDAIGICISGLSRHYYDGHYWPEKIETIHDEDILSWLENHVCVVPMFPRQPGCSVVEGKDITPEKVRALTEAAERCWEAILRKDLQAFASAFQASFEAQIDMFPAMMQPGVQEWIDKVKPHALAWKMLGAGGGGNLLLVVGSIPDFAIPIRIRRRD